MTQKVRHILPVSGGKDSAALAVFMRDRLPDVEYAFCDTGEELPETYDYINRLEVYLGKPIHRLNPDRLFAHYLAMKNGYLPSPRMRWCTQMLKIKPFETFVGDGPVVSYIGIRADEDREAYISHKPNIQPAYPFREAGIVLSDVRRILEDAGLGLPSYYSWRSRSGCYFCFFQQRIEWIGLLDNHPDLYEKAAQFEHCNSSDGRKYTWADGESLAEVRVRRHEIEESHRKMMERAASRAGFHVPLSEVFSACIDMQETDEPCLICQL